MFGDIIQPTHLLFILVVALVFLGPKRLPEVGRALGKGIKDFRGAMSGLEEHTSDIFDSKVSETPQRHQPEPEPVMAAATSAEQPALTGAATQETPAVAPRVDDQN